MFLRSIPRIGSTVLGDGCSRPAPVRSLGNRRSRRSTADTAGVCFGEAAKSFDDLILGMRVQMGLQGHPIVQEQRAHGALHERVHVDVTRAM